MRANAEVLEDIEGNANWLLHYVGGSTQSSDRMRRDIVEFEDELAGVIEGNTDWLLHVGKRRSRTRSRGWEGCGVGDAEWATSSYGRSRAVAHHDMAAVGRREPVHPHPVRAKRASCRREHVRCSLCSRANCSQHDGAATRATCHGATRRVQGS